ncbi:MAG TPA: DUF2079 domain-containing protein [Chloroflexota bacterium]|nr:DUF2079 domain-containing protein [Chloroflexota bacterium]
MVGNSIPIAVHPTAMAHLGARTRDRVAWIVAVGGCVAFIAILSWFAQAQHNAYSTGQHDLEIYSQVIWNTANGHPYETTLLKTNRSHLAEHLSGAVLLLAPLYKLVPEPMLLIVIQQVALGLAALPIYAFARVRGDSPGIALLAAAGYLCSSAAASIALDDFHPVALTALPLGLSAYCLLTGRARAALVAALIALFLEEEASLVIIGLGLMVLGQRRWKPGLGWLALGSVYLALAVFVVMPRFHQQNTLAEGTPNRSVGHFQELLTRPSVLTDRLFGERLRDGLTSLILPAGGLALLQPQLLIASVPSFAALFLQDRDDTFHRHWTAPMLPLVWMATAAGIAQLRSGRARLAASCVVIAASAFAYRADSPLPGGGNYDSANFERTERSEILDDLVSRVPPDARVSASVNVVAHLANRPGVYVFPPGDHYAAGIERQARRPNAFVLDLFDSGTQRIAALDQYSPLMQEPIYSVWSPGHKALLLLDRPPPAPGGSTAIFDDDIRLIGTSVRETPHGIELEMQWQKFHAFRGRLARQITVVDEHERVVDREDDMTLSSVFGANKWQLGQVIVDTYRIKQPAGSTQLTARVAWVSRDKQTPIEVDDGNRSVDIPLLPR